MAGLSAFFVFAGLTLYTYGLNIQSNESRQNTNNNHGLLLQLTGLIVFTLLAMFSKENGVLLPVFALVLEITVLAKVSTINYRRKLRISACSTGLIAILLYLFYLTYNASNISPGRDHTLIERLLTQPQILIDYLYVAFIPDITGFNPFHDNYPHVVNFWSSNKAILSLSLLVFLLSSSLYYRLKHPLFSFAVLWFLSAHLLESTVINLELYFEHRNYVALFGPCFSIVLTFTKIKQRYRKLTILSFGVYWLLLCICLLLTTQIWGEPRLAAKVWQGKQVGSARATEYLSTIYLKEGKIEAGQQLLINHIKECKNCTNSQAISLFFSCYSGKEDATRAAYNALLKLSETTTRATGVAANLRQVHQLMTNGSCQYISMAELKRLNIAFLQSPKSMFNKKLPYLQNLYIFAQNEGNNEEAIRLLFLAWHEQPENIIANELVLMLISNLRVQEAKSFVKEQVCQRTSLNPIMNEQWQEQCNFFSERIKAIIEIKSNNEAQQTTTDI